jgi:hypothetical protein
MAGLFNGNGAIVKTNVDSRALPIPLQGGGKANPRTDQFNDLHGMGKLTIEIRLTILALALSAKSHRGALP